MTYSTGGGATSPWGIGLDLTSQSPKCLRMVLITSWSSMKLIYVKLHINQFM